jgi:hypothetical protein
VASAADTSQQFCRFGGRVLNSLTGEPLKKAELTLRSAQYPDLSYRLATDEQGGFSLPAVHGGEYDLVVQRTGFVRTAKPVTLVNGDTTTETIIRLSPQGVITGRVVDRDGDPLARATVEAIQAHYNGGIRRYVVAGTAVTDDRGEYRLFGLKAGSYYLGGVYHGAAGDAAAYYPSGLQASQAVAIDVPTGNEVRGVELMLSDPLAVTVRGTIQAPPGLPVGGLTINLVPCDSGPLDRLSTSVRNADGVFELRGIGPGCHILAADSFNTGRRFSARLPLNVTNSNIDSLQLSLLPPRRLTGRVHTDSGSGPKLGPVIVNLESRSSQVTASGSPREDGSLSIDNIVPETYEISAILPEGYYLKSARFGSIDVLQAGLDLSQGDGGKLDLEISAAGGRIDGSVGDGDNQPGPGARVVLVPADERSRRLAFQMTTADQKGAFRISGIAPGDYRLYGFQTFDAGALQDPTYLKRFDSQSKVVAIHEHGQEVLQLKPIRAEGDL